MSDNGGGEGSSAPEVQISPVEASSSLAATATASGASGTTEVECKKVEEGASASGEVAVPAVMVELEGEELEVAKPKGQFHILLCFTSLHPVALHI